MDNNNITLNKRIRKASTKYNNEEYDTLTASQKRAITRELKSNNKADRQKAYKERNGEAKIREIVDKRAKTKELNMKILNSFKIFDKGNILNTVVNIFKNYSDKTIKQLLIKIKGYNVLQIKVNKNLMSRDNIKKLSQDVSNEMKKLNVGGTIYTTLKFNENKYRSGESSKFGEPVKIFHGIKYDFEDDEDDDQAYFNSFNMYLVEDTKPQGGTNDNNNNCFYECIKEVLKNGCPWSDTFEFKKWLKVPYYNKVKLEDIEKLKNI